ncbi:hypothetical protein GBAR_LOCUS6728 [Geodia barretti]|uniref:Extracellular solute-binding protein n=1 Tax=Geodia barretti TaxID=519541 RepID=A0AA35W6P4_GEOBA|nr:hypothetical protein GBAR_LOCUS6728 [Geodia barretti]
MGGSRLPGIGHRRRGGRSMRMIRLAVTLTLVALVGSLCATAEEMTMVSWGGAYGRATEKALLEPFGAQTGYTMNVEDYNGGLAEIRAQVETGNVHWDVVDLEAADAVRGCDEGLLEVVAAQDVFPGQDARRQRKIICRGCCRNAASG